MYSRYIGFQGIFSHLLKCGYRPHFVYGSRESHNAKYVRRRNCNLHMPIVLPSLSNKELLSKYHPLRGRMRGHTDLDSIFIGQVLNTMSPLIQKNSLAQEKPTESNPIKSSKSAASSSSSKSIFTDNYLFESWNSIKNSKSESRRVEGDKQKFQEGQVLQISYRYGNGDMFKGNCVVVRGPNSSLIPEIDEDIGNDNDNMPSKKSVKVKSGSKKLMDSSKDDRGDGFDRLPRGLTIIKHGHGVFRKKEGDLYIGEFQDDKMCGYGVYKYSRHTTVVR